MAYPRNVKSAISKAKRELSVVNRFRKNKKNLELLKSVKSRIDYAIREIKEFMKTEE